MLRRRRRRSQPLPVGSGFGGQGLLSADDRGAGEGGPGRTGRHGPREMIAATSSEAVSAWATWGRACPRRWTDRRTSAGPRQAGRVTGDQVVAEPVRGEGGSSVSIHVDNEFDCARPLRSGSRRNDAVNLDRVPVLPTDVGLIQSNLPKQWETWTLTSSANNLRLDPNNQNTKLLGRVPNGQTMLFRINIGGGPFDPAEIRLIGMTALRRCKGTRDRPKPAVPLGSTVCP